jgi:hypothetical protein
MATITLDVANPTGADVTTNSKTAKAHMVTALTFDNTQMTGGGTDLFYFLANGCAVTSSTGSTFLQREQQGFMLEMDETDIQ